jgi:hypothetical protein
MVAGEYTFVPTTSTQQHVTGGTQQLFQLRGYYLPP